MRPWLKILLILFILGLLGGFIGYKFFYNKQHPDYEVLKEDFSMDAKQLFEGFKRNPEGFARLYNGKVGIVTGRLSHTEIVDSTVTAVFVFNQGDFGDEGIRCVMLSKYNIEAQRLQPDGEVSLKGYCTGFNDTDVIFEKCSIVLH